MSLRGLHGALAKACPAARSCLGLNRDELLARRKRQAHHRLLFPLQLPVLLLLLLLLRLLLLLLLLLLVRLLVVLVLALLLQQ
jgi:hypothetical protein